MKSLFWFSAVDIDTETFIHAAVVIANGRHGAYEKALVLGIKPKPNVELACFQLPWEERHVYEGHFDRLLSLDDVKYLGCKSIRDWRKEEAN